MLVVPKEKSEKKDIAEAIYYIHCQGKASSVRNLIFGRLNIRSKPDFLNMDIQAPTHRKSPY